jgi:hypothetical protein
MRDLLAGIQADTDRRDPQPTAAAIADLCARHGVPLRTTGQVRPLPPDVDLSAYRVVELALGAGTPPSGTAVEVDHGDTALTVTVPTPDGTALAGLRGRVAAVGGTVTVRADQVQVTLPARLSAGAGPRQRLD